MTAIHAKIAAKQLNGDDRIHGSNKINHGHHKDDAVKTVQKPAVSRQESNRVRLKRTMRQLLLMAGLIGCLSSCVLFLFAQPISMLLYGEPALTGVLMALSPLSMLFAIQQVQFGLVTGLGVQRRAMPGTIVSSALTLVVMSIFCPMPSVRIFGAVLAMLAGSLVRVIWNAAVLQSAKRAA